MNIKINLHLSEIVYDVQNKTYLTGRSRAGATDPERVAAMQANDDEENANQVLRSVGTAMGVLTTRLSDYIESETTVGDNELLSSEAVLRLDLTVPANFNQAAVKGVAEAAHAYVVAAAVADWFTITDKADATEYRQAAERWLAVLVEAVSRRRRPQRTVIDRKLPVIG